MARAEAATDAAPLAVDPRSGAALQALECDGRREWRRRHLTHDGVSVTASLEADRAAIR
jgi:hypothetical protein